MRILLPKELSKENCLAISEPVASVIDLKIQLHLKYKEVYLQLANVCAGH